MTTGVVVIGRNEGQRLIDCLNSIDAAPLVYVDSGSTDQSFESAKSLGAIPIALDLAIPFTAARARNAGFQYLLTHYPDLEYVFFVDGDCRVASDWMTVAGVHMETDSTLGVVCGRRKELHPERSIYNAFCDIEWDTPVGPASACGGDALYRVSALQKVGGFDPKFIAGEEPELCFRIRQEGYRIERLDADMTYHDAAMTKFSQWWKRSERSGHAYYLGWAKHGRANQEHFYQRELKSILTWCGIAVTLSLMSVLLISWIPMAVLAGILGLQTARIFRRLDPKYKVLSVSLRLLYSASLMVCKVPQGLGVIRAHRIKQKGQVARLVEYK